MNTRLRVAILFGGRSGEHDISLLSAGSIISALDLEKYDLVPIGIDRKGDFQSLKDSIIMIHEYLEKDKLHYFETQLQSLPSDFSITSHKEKVDVAFPVLHGTYGEDGTVQGFLEILDIPYVGAGVLSSSVGMDKVLMKKVLQTEGVPQVNYLSFRLSRLSAHPSACLCEVEETLGYPCFIKPANLGSSVGISKASNKDELLQGFRLAGQYDQKIIVEEFIDAREIEVAVLGNEELVQATMPGEVIPENEFYDFESKYTKGKMNIQIPAQLSEVMLEKIRYLAITSFKAIDGSGLARIDFFVRKDNGEILLNEINTMPGFTPLSMYPKLWAHAGIGYTDLLDKLIQLALDRHRDKKRLIT